MSAIIDDDAELAARLAEAAGRIAVEVRESGLIDGKALGKAGDAVANAFLMRAIAEQRPDDGVLSEESADTEERLSKERVWIIDPVDGTREYGERRSDWAVHVGLAIGGKPVIGAVALPGVPQVLRTDQVNALPPAPETLRMVVSRTRPGADSAAVAEAIGAELVPMGSAGAKAMSIIRGEADIYLHSGGQYEWDNCAPAAVALAHGLHVSRIDGSPMTYNHKDVSLPDLLICRPEHAERVLKLVAELS
ncbi:3'(2'),5'-bisphosphate nucleotidase CysQ [Croceicoccus naphthovorans]|uniref:Inositol phosphatase n=1 Tax=Croceicoccus naphthovorans TaxID=1348774 RepID=A0A0G3XG10_9SPHN|nr:3'(2'),5'-bisphosphate nucleotidase CysQ [Croceicoccus naphthovorans]AKM09333.1 inositol phosphatase [Croceicoccus naphthovorans]MBB3990244.1 3'(2'), 5'-bisphosphate nucleotidase [Croceicoccus naphthovorans]